MARWLLRATFSEGMCYRQREVVQRNRRIGVGILGFQEWLYKGWHLRFDHLTLAHHGVRETLKEMRESIWLEAEAYAAELGIAFPVKVTTVAPTGTTAKISGTTEGIHPVFSRYFIRRVRFADNDVMVEVAENLGLHVEDDLMNPHTKIVSYPCRDAALDVVPESHLCQADEISPHQLLTVQRVVQDFYADNAVSFTVNFDPEKFGPAYVEDVLATHGRYLKGTTFMPEGSYEQAPIERISRERYDELVLEGETYAASSALDCVGGACPIR